MIIIGKEGVVDILRPLIGYTKYGMKLKMSVSDLSQAEKAETVWVRPQILSGEVNCNLIYLKSIVIQKR
jgi:hypothetical protein